MSEVVVDAGLNDLLYSAIQQKRLIRFRYKNLVRVVEPHDYGIQKGKARLLSWQVAGESSGRIPGWRWFDVNGIQECEMLERSFPGNRDSVGNHHQWDQLFIRVAPVEKSEKKAS